MNIPCDQGMREARLLPSRCLDDCASDSVSDAETAPSWKRCVDPCVSGSHDDHGLFRRDESGVCDNGDQRLGFAYAQTAYAACRSEGLGVDTDLTEVAHYLKLAADQGDAEAQCRYGICLHKGSGVDIDLVEAARYFWLPIRDMQRRNTTMGFVFRRDLVLILILLKQHII